MFKQWFARLRSVFQPIPAPETPPSSLQEKIAEVLGRPIPGDEKVHSTIAELVQLAGLQQVENELMRVEIATLELLLADAREELDYLKGYPHGKG